MGQTSRQASAYDPLAFLVGGGEMGERTRAFDWSTTPVGPVTGWPQSLKTAVRLVLDARYPMFVWWGAGLTKFYNDAYAVVLGQRHPDALGRPAAEVWADIWNVVGPQAEAALTEGRATWSEEQLLVMERNQFLEETYFTYSYSPIPADGGGIGGVLCTCTDDTNRVLSQRRLRTLRSLLERANQAKNAEGACAVAAATLSENTHDVPFALLYLLDDDRRRARLAGVSGIGRDAPATPAVVDLDDSGAPWPFRAAVEVGGAVEVTDLQAKFGPLPGGAWPESPQRAVVVPMAKAGLARLAGFVVAGVSPRLVFNDEYKGFFDLLAGHVAAAVANARAYEEERKRAEMLAELDRAKTAFFNNVSHEFRTPLTLMLGPVEDLLARSHTDLSPDAARQLEVVNRNGLRLLRLVNTLLDFSRIEAGRVRARFQPTDLATLTADLASGFRSACERAGLRLVVDCPRLSEQVYVDREMWEKVVLNLLSNAFKFTFEGEIVVGLRLEGNAARLMVRDTGTGIPADEMPRLFERFHRVQNARGRTHEGSGIGLALVQELVRLHGGSIAAESVVGRGTAFTVSVPLGVTHLPPDQVGEGRALPPAATEATPYVEEALRWLPGDGRAEVPDYQEPLPTPQVELGRGDGDDRPRVLVADDNADMRQYVARLLAEQFRVEVAADGEAALQAARERPPDLILSDVMMPRLDGFRLLREVRADSRLSSLPVLLLSARAGEASRVAGFEAGADDYLVKPFGARELLARVTAHLQIARIRREANQSLRESEGRLRMALTAARMVAWQWDPVEDTLALSDNAADVFGLPPGSALATGAQKLALIHTDDVGQHRATVQRALAACESYASQFRMTRREGQAVIWLEEQGYCVGDGAAKPARLVGVVMDITDRKLAEEQRRVSEERFRNLFNSMDEGFCVIEMLYDTDGKPVDYRFLEVNPTFEKHTGFVDAVGRTIRELVPDQDAHWFEIYGGVAATGEPSRFTNEARAMGRWYDVYAYRLGGPGSNKVGILFTDITERRRAEQELAEAHQFLQSSIDALSSHIAVLDENGVVLAVNDAWRRFADANNYRGHNYGVGSNYVEECEPGRGQCVAGGTVAEGLSDVLRGRQAYFELEYPCHSPTEERWFVMRVTRFKSPGPVRVVVAHEDVTKRKKAEGALREADRRKDEFLATLAHELRNPLAPLRNGLQVMKLARDDGNAVEQARAMMDRQLSQMVRLIDDLMDLSRISRGKVELRKGRVELAKVIQQAVETSRPLIEASGHDFGLDVPPEPIYVDADTTRLAQVFSNLLNNAAKYTERGGRITLRLERQGSDAVVSVRDTGVGIPAHMLPKVFDMFTQVDGSLEKSQGGLGIGLTLVKRLAELHGGSVEAHSEGHGTGSEFMVRLPVALSPAGDQEGGEAEAVGPVGRHRILVVDDNRDSALSMAMLLKLMGNSVRTAHDGEEGVQAAGEFRPDVVLLDIGLPKLNGYDAARRIRQQPWGANVFLIAVTGWGQDEDRRKSEEAGFDRHLVKPVDPQHLMTLLAELNVVRA